MFFSPALFKKKGFLRAYCVSFDLLSSVPGSVTDHFKQITRSETLPNSLLHTYIPLRNIYDYFHVLYFACWELRSADLRTHIIAMYYTDEENVKISAVGRTSHIEGT